MRTPEENRIYMSQYMKLKYLNNTDEIKLRNKLSYERNKYSTINQRKRLQSNLDKINNNLVLLLENNTDTDEVIEDFKTQLENIILFLSISLNGK